MSEITEARVEEGESVDLPDNIDSSHVAAGDYWIYFVDDSEATRSTYIRRKEALTSNPTVPSPSNMIVLRFSGGYIDYLEKQ